MYITDHLSPVAARIPMITGGSEALSEPRILWLLPEERSENLVGPEALTLNLL